MLVPRSFQIKLKYSLDRLGAAVLLLVLSPVLFLIALLIKAEDGGRVFFRQERLGEKARVFVVWKFRTMVPDADRLLDGSGRVGKVNRITRIGRFLRSLSLDELPQLLNVAGGKMSFVGPRPAIPQHLKRYTEEQKGRLRMRPGVTGWAQVNGRNTLRWSKRIEHDNWYIDNYSLWLDIRILFRTLRVVAFGEGIVLDRNPEEVDDLRPLEKL